MKTTTAYEFAQFMCGHTGKKGCLLLCKGLPAVYMTSPCEDRALETMVQCCPDTHFVLVTPTNPVQFSQTMCGELEIGIYHKDSTEAQQELKYIDRDRAYETVKNIITTNLNSP